MFSFLKEYIKRKRYENLRREILKLLPPEYKEIYTRAVKDKKLPQAIQEVRKLLEKKEKLEKVDRYILHRLSDIPAKYLDDWILLVHLVVLSSEKSNSERQ